MTETQTSPHEVELSPATLDRLDPRIAVPGYDRRALHPGIVHIGVGGFHRAHQAVYLDDLCARGETGWSIAGAGVLPGDAAMAAALGPQDGLYTLVTRDLHGTSVRVIGSLTEYVHAHPSVDPLVALLVRPETRIVTLTITEGGYPVDEATGAFRPAADGTLPPAFLAIARGLAERRARGLGGFTVLSCDNVMHNGAIARAAVVGVAGALAPDLAPWVEEHVAFPNSMVDRITPATSDADRAFLRERYGLVDRWPVVAETFIQWVVEDVFPYGRPAFEDVGVLFTADVRPYETLKLRLLNAGHSTLAYLAALGGIVFVHEVLAEPRFAGFLRRFHAEEAVPSLPPVAGIDPVAYTAKVAERFANPEVRDQVARICLDGSSKLPKFLVPTVEAQLDRGASVRFSALAVAGWCRYLLGRADDGSAIVPSADPRLARAQELARAAETDPRAFLGFREVFGDRLPAAPAFADAFVAAHAALRADGVRATLDRWLQDAS